MHKSLDQKLAAIHADPSGCREFIIADAKDADMAFGVAITMGVTSAVLFLTHDDRRPFFGGTYFPKDARFGMPAFSTVLRRVAEYYREQPAEQHRRGAARHGGQGDGVVHRHAAARRGRGCRVDVVGVGVGVGPGAAAGPGIRRVRAVHGGGRGQALALGGERAAYVGVERAGVGPRSVGQATAGGQGGARGGAHERHPSRYTLPTSRRCPPLRNS